MNFISATRNVSYFNILSTIIIVQTDVILYIIRKNQSILINYNKKNLKRINTFRTSKIYPMPQIKCIRDKFWHSYRYLKKAFNFKILQFTNKILSIYTNKI